MELLETTRHQKITICLLLDACTDDSVALAASYRARSRHQIDIADAISVNANAGRARHRAMAMGQAALSARDGLLLTTDSDTAPARDWLRVMVSALAGSDVVAGRIKRQSVRPSQLQDRLEFYYDELFALRRRLDPVSWEANRTHHFCGGANLGIRLRAYEMLGGFTPVPSGEDAKLVDDASRAGLRVRRDAASVVYTSDRREGRATGGLASALRELDEGAAANIEVTHPADAAWQYAMQAIARAAYDDERPASLEAALGFTRDHVRGVRRDCPNAEAFAMRIVPEAPAGMRSVSLPTAEVELARIIGLREAA
ncbi:glycosyltransferase [Sphingomonas nostoxanthinifaciens]|uniref:glycosyltransferase n=1 Tax=Sphingomonas nostoxanthinifaciens TaxID=2872652 RepID=UPI0021DAC6E3|nr:glycosyltransferase [Sphingomonas nostoxanthinifaciens]